MRFLLCQINTDFSGLPINQYTQNQMQSFQIDERTLTSAGGITQQELSNYFAPDGTIKNLDGFKNLLESKGWTTGAIDTMFAQKEDGSYYFFDRQGFSPEKMTLKDFENFIEKQVIRYAEQSGDTTKSWFEYTEFKILQVTEQQKSDGVNAINDTINSQRTPHPFSQYSELAGFFNPDGSSKVTAHNIDIFMVKLIEAYDKANPGKSPTKAGIYFQAVPNINSYTVFKGNWGELLKDKDLFPGSGTVTQSRGITPAVEAPRSGDSSATEQQLIDDITSLVSASNPGIDAINDIQSRVIDLPDTSQIKVVAQNSLNNFYGNWFSSFINEYSQQQQNAISAIMSTEEYKNYQIAYADYERASIAYETFIYDPEKCTLNEETGTIEFNSEESADEYERLESTFSVKSLALEFQSNLLLPMNIQFETAMTNIVKENVSEYVNFLSNSGIFASDTNKAFFEQTLGEGEEQINLAEYTVGELAKYASIGLRDGSLTIEEFTEMEKIISNLRAWNFEVGEIEQIILANEMNAIYMKMFSFDDPIQDEDLMGINQLLALGIVRRESLFDLEGIFEYDEEQNKFKVNVDIESSLEEIDSEENVQEEATEETREEVVVQNQAQGQTSVTNAQTINPIQQQFDANASASFVNPNLRDNTNTRYVNPQNPGEKLIYKDDSGYGQSGTIVWNGGNNYTVNGVSGYTVNNGVLTAPRVADDYKFNIARQGQVSTVYSRQDTRYFNAEGDPQTVNIPAGTALTVSNSYHFYNGDKRATNYEYYQITSQGRVYYVLTGKVDKQAPNVGAVNAQVAQSTQSLLADENNGINLDDVLSAFFE